MAVLLKVKNSQIFVENLNLILENSIGDKSETWIVKRFPNGVFYTHYKPNGVWNYNAWFRVCPDDVRKAYNDSREVSYNLIFRLHGVRGFEMTKELYGFYHSRFVEFLLTYLIDGIKEISMTTLKDDIEFLDKFENYDWR